MVCTPMQKLKLLCDEQQPDQPRAARRQPLSPRARERRNVDFERLGGQREGNKIRLKTSGGERESEDHSRRDPLAEQFIFLIFVNRQKTAEKQVS